MKQDYEDESVYLMLGDCLERKDKLQDYFMRSLNSLLVMEVLELQS